MNIRCLGNGIFDGRYRIKRIRIVLFQTIRSRNRRRIVFQTRNRMRRVANPGVRPLMLIQIGQIFIVRRPAQVAFPSATVIIMKDQIEHDAHTAFRMETNIVAKSNGIQRNFSFQSPILPTEFFKIIVRIIRRIFRIVSFAEMCIFVFVVKSIL